MKTTEVVEICECCRQRPPTQVVKFVDDELFAVCDDCVDALR